MGVFSTIHRFREAGEAPNVHNVENFGPPARSLYTTTKIFSLRHHIDVTDGEENVVYQATTKILTVMDKTDLTDVSGHLVAHIERKLLSFHERHYVEMADGTRFQLSNEFFHLVKDITNIEGLGWQLRGNILGLNFELYDEGGRIIALISQKMISLHDKYCMDIYQPELEAYVVAILVTLQHMIADRERASTSARSPQDSN